mmetsp:Transcript_22988/g.53790  ORF Transcript_22988/g.53790 Transcript_22988/m.53790 type:complete len:206 (-) Transcript_22988:425-1042(-)
MRTILANSSLLISGPFFFLLLLGGGTLPASTGFAPSPDPSDLFAASSGASGSLLSPASWSLEACFACSSGLSGLSGLSTSMGLPASGSAAWPSFTSVWRCSAWPSASVALLFVAAPRSPSALSAVELSCPSALSAPGKSASSFSGSISHCCLSRKAQTSALVSSLLSSPEIAAKRSSTLPPLASMHTRSLVATSSLKASYSANAL